MNGLDWKRSLWLPVPEDCAGCGTPTKEFVESIQFQGKRGPGSVSPTYEVHRRCRTCTEGLSRTFDAVASLKQLV